MLVVKKQHSALMSMVNPCSLFPTQWEPHLQEPKQLMTPVKCAPPTLSLLLLAPNDSLPCPTNGSGRLPHNFRSRARGMGCCLTASAHAQHRQGPGIAGQALGGKRPLGEQSPQSLADLSLISGLTVTTACLLRS